MRFEPEDFRVDEVPLYAPTGEGEHTFVRVEKRLRTTEDVARALARAAGVRPRDVGYAGRKDRVAVTTQWFSVPGLDPTRAQDLTLAGARVLEAARHGHKLRTGHLSGNRFRVTVDGGDAAAARARIEVLVRDGLPNRFGGQRFGRDGRNPERARRVLAGEAAGTDRRSARFLISALQAQVFNAVLAEREPPLSRLEAGDVAVVHDSGGLFVVDDPAAEQPRADSFEISPTGPIFGTRRRSPDGMLTERERAILSRFGIDPANLHAPRGIPLRGARRPLRVRPGEAQVLETPRGVEVRFRLPPGSYATVLLDEVFGGDGSPDPDDTPSGKPVS